MRRLFRAVPGNPLRYCRELMARYQAVPAPVFIVSVFAHRVRGDGRVITLGGRQTPWSAGVDALRQLTNAT
jgi:hypothetical protein